MTSPGEITVWRSFRGPEARPAPGSLGLITVQWPMAAVVALGEDHRIHFGWFNAQDDRWNEPVWAALDGPVVHGPIVQEVGSEAFVFGVDAAGRVLSAHLPNPGHAPGGWTELEGACVGRPATTSWDVNRLDLFARDGRGVLRQTWLEHRGAGWEPKLRWVDVAEGLVEPPAAVSWGPERLDLFTRTASGELVHKWWDDAADRLDAFTIRDSTPLSHKYWDPGTGWLPAPLSEWEHLGGSLTIPPTVVTWGKYHLDVFSRGTDGHLHHIWWNPESGWSPQAAWEDMRGVLGDSLAAVAWSRDRLGVFCRSVDGSLLYKYRDPGIYWRPSLTRWYESRLPGGATMDSPVSATTIGGTVVLVVRGSDDRIHVASARP